MFRIMYEYTACNYVDDTIYFRVTLPRDKMDDHDMVGTQWKEPARGGPCYELMSSTNEFQPFPPSGASTPEVERCL